MRVAKIKKTEKKKKEVMEESYTLKDMLLIVLLVLIAFIIFYFITYFVVKKDVDTTETSSNVEIDETKITFNNLLNRKEDTYYVLAYRSNVENTQTNFKNIYDSYISTYKYTANSLPFYYIDIDDAFNKSFIGEELNISEDLSSLKINDEALFKISNGKIEESFVGREEILNKLSTM